VVLGDELEGHGITSGSRNLIRAVGQGAVGTNQDDVVGLRESSANEREGSEDGGEAHLEVYEMKLERMCKICFFRAVKARVVLIVDWNTKKE